MNINSKLVFHKSWYLVFKYKQSIAYPVSFVGSIGSVSATLPFTLKNKVGDVELKDMGNRTQVLRIILEVFCQFNSISETTFDSEELKKMSKSV